MEIDSVEVQSSQATQENLQETLAQQQLQREGLSNTINELKIEHRQISSEVSMRQQDF